MATTEEDKAAKAADGKATVLLDQLRANSRLLVEAIQEVNRRSERVDRKMAAFVDAVDRLLKAKSPEVVEGVRAAWEKEERPERAGEARK